MKKQLLVFSFLMAGLGTFAQCPPQIICPTNISVPNDPGKCDAVVTFCTPAGIDTCNTNTQSYAYTGVIDTFIVPAGVTSINVLARGAEGGTGHAGTFDGGDGAIMQGDFCVTPGDTVWIVVGGAGGNGISSRGGGGGGGSFVFTGAPGGPGLMIAAGGGGGAGEENTNNGCDARTDTNATLGPTSCAAGLGNGQGGQGGDAFGGGGGAGWYSAGTDYGNYANSGGTLFVGGTNHGGSGAFGGFGGGGGTHDGGGGGGGYTGGRGGNNTTGIGGGAGSFNGGTNQNNSVGNTGNGSVVVTWYPAVPTNQTAGLPSGATFPVGTTVNTFVTQNSGGSDTCTFTVTVSDGSPATVLAAFPNDTVCTSASPITLPGGTPAGGSYTGTGVTGSTFDPAISGIGTFWVYYTDTVNCPVTDSTAITVEICAGVTEATNRDGFEVSPNPSNGMFIIRTQDGNATRALVEVFDLVGKKLRSFQINGTSAKLDLTSEPTGVYLMRLRQGGNTSVYKLTKK